jgi:hypothetical protein
MWRTIIAVLGGAIAWIVIATAGNLVLRQVLPGYAEVEKSMHFDPPMMASRLVLGALACLGAGFVAAWIGRGRRSGVWILVALLLALFIPEHYALRDKLPLWYHLAFLLSLLVLTVAGGSLYRPTSPVPAGSADSGGEAAQP